MSKAAKSDHPDRQILEGIGNGGGRKRCIFETLKGQILEGIGSRKGRKKRIFDPQSLDSRGDLLQKGVEKGAFF